MWVAFPPLAAIRTMVHRIRYLASLAFLISSCNLRLANRDKSTTIPSMGAPFQRTCVRRFTGGSSHFSYLAETANINCSKLLAGDLVGE